MDVRMLQCGDWKMICYSGLMCTARCESFQNLSPAKLEKFITDRIKEGHTSLLEHLYYTFEINHMSRDLLQQFTRTRIQSQSVESTRWALKKTINTATMEYPEDMTQEQRALVEEYMEKVRRVPGTNDQKKGMLPGVFPTSTVWTINARSLRHVFATRAKAPAFQPYQDLMAKVYRVLPLSHRFLFDDLI